MAKRSPAGKRKFQSRPDIYQTVTDRIIAQLEDGIFPWAQPWDSSKTCAVAGSIDLPRNPTTGAAYSGINVMLLWMSASEQAYPTQRWMTYRQAQSVGAQVRRGEASTEIVKAGTFVRKDEREAASLEGRTPAKIPFLKSHRVFNVAQIDDLPDEFDATLPEPDLSAVDQNVRAILNGIGVKHIIGTANACYRPSTDVVQIPSPDAFFDSINWHRTALHELVHSTGHHSRLNRDLSNGFGSPAYAKEELIAEIGAAMTCAQLGIVPSVRHADYIGSWLKVLHNDNRCIVQAASAAGKAAEYMLQHATHEVQQAA